MRSLLPWISYARKDCVLYDESSRKSTSKALLPHQESKPFKLKHLNKHVSQYERVEEEPLEKMRETISSAGHTYRKKERYIGEEGNKTEEIMQKAKQIHNKYYASLMAKIEQKGQLMNSLSLKRFQISQKENSLLSLGKCKTKLKEKNVPPLWSHMKSSSSASLKDEMKGFKVGRQFRSKWFTELQNIKGKE